MNVGRYLRGETQHVGTARITNTKDIKMSEPKLIRIVAETISPYDVFYGSFDSAIEYLVNCQEILISKGFQNLTIEAESYGHDGGVDINVYGDRFETSRELADRLKKEEKEREWKQKADAKKDAEDLKLYKKLQKKFGKLS